MTIDMYEEPDITVVQNASRMDSDTFRMHMNKRHRASLGNGQKAIWSFASDYVEGCYRTFHDTIHRLTLQKDMDHDHGI